jgi:CHASE1-domain containing sensor protein
MNINPPRKFYNQCLPWLLSGLTLLIGGTATLAYWHHFEKQQHQAVNLNFQAESERLAATISQQLNSYQVVMRGVQGFFQSSEQITYPEFLRYIDSLDITRDLRGGSGHRLCCPSDTEEPSDTPRNRTQRASNKLPNNASCRKSRRIGPHYLY